MNSSTSNKFFVRTFPSNELLKFFNEYLGTSYSSYNRPTKNEKANNQGKGYSQALSDAKSYIKLL
jgi:hypothetical protein